MKKSFASGRLIGFIIGLGVILLLPPVRHRIQDVVFDLRRPPVPSAMPYPSGTSIPTRTPTPIITVMASPRPSASPVAVNLDIPFVSQAPHKIWDEDHQEFCEEASALMAASYIRGDHSVTNPDVAETALQKVKTYQMETFGYFKDTTAAETARILREHFDISAVKVIANPSEADIRTWVSQGKAVLVPAAGRELGNPNFTAPGPIYHMIVIKGYTAEGMFITNDPGTRKGADYLYSPSVIMNAMHDWNNGDVYNGAKVVIVVG